MINEEKYKDIKAFCSERSIELIAVSKKQSIEKIRYLYDLGHRDFGENRVEELQKKRFSLPDDIRWHFIGNLQSKKVKFLDPLPYLIHSVDRQKLLGVLQSEAIKRGEIIRILVQLKIAKEESKYGFSFEEAEDIIHELLTAEKYPNLALNGLMGMATFTDNQEQIRSEFQAIAKFMNKLRDKYPAEENHVFKYLSIGMSDDYPIAVEEGGNMIRVGSAIFGPRIYE